MKKENISKVLRLFCGTEDSRQFLHNPFIQKGYGFATDAHSLIMVPGSYVSGFTEQAKPDCWGVIPENLDNNEAVLIDELHAKLSALPMIAQSDECSECGGSGKVTCDYHHTHDCPDCHASGRVNISKDKMVVNERLFVNYLNQIFKAKELLRVVKACQLLEIDTIYLRTNNADKPNRAALFHADDLTILVMPAGLIRSVTEEKIFDL